MTAMARPGTVRLRWLCIGVALAVIIAALVGYRVRQLQVPAPPEIDLRDMDPAVGEAVESARAAVICEPRSADTWGRLGKILAAHGLWEAADPCFVEAERLDPMEPRWPYFSGVGRSLGHPETAIEPLRRAVALGGVHPEEPHLRLAELLLALGQRDEAETLFQEVLKRVPNIARAHLGLARLAVDRDEWGRARTHLEACGECPWTRKAAAGLLAEVDRRGGNLKAAARAQRQQQRLPDDVEPPDPWTEELTALQVGQQATLGRARQLLKQERTEEAVAVLRKAVLDHPKSAAVWLGLGRALIQARDEAAGEEAVRQAAQLSPMLVEAQFYLGVARFQQGDPAGAATYFRRAVAMRPDHAIAWFNLGQCLDRQGDQAGAITALLAAVRHKPYHAQAHAVVGRLLMQAGRRPEALRHLKQAVALDPEDTESQRRYTELKHER